MDNPKSNTYLTQADSITLDLWRTVGHGDVFATKAVAEAFARHPDLAEGQREAIVTTLYAMLSQARRLQHALRPNGEELPANVSRALAELLAFRVLEKKLSPAGAQMKIPEIDWNAVVANNAALADEPDTVKRIALGASLPDFLAKRLVEQYGAEAEALANALSGIAPLSLRVNTLKATREEVLEELSKWGVSAKLSKLTSAGIELNAHINVFSLESFQKGHFEVQDEASQIVSELVAPPPKGIVVDFCAGAGGKTLALGALMNNKGRLLAVDIHDRKLDELQRRARRAGLANTQAIVLTDEWPSDLQRLLGKADRVLADVPCSGVGAFRRKPEMRWRLAPEDLEQLPREQEAISRRGMQLLAPGGRLIYATCTVLKEENEDVVARLLSDTDFELVPVKEVIGSAKASKVCAPGGVFLKLLPHRHSCDGFFAAILRRKRK